MVHKMFDTLTSCGVMVRKSMPLGNACRRRPLVFSFVPRWYGQPGSAEYIRVPSVCSSRGQSVN